MEKLPCKTVASEFGFFFPAQKLVSVFSMLLGGFVIVMPKFVLEDD